MKIDVTPRLPARVTPDVVCRFQNLDHRIGARRRDAGENRAVTITGEGSTVVLTIDVAEYKNYESDEARRIAGGAAIKHIKKSGGRQLVWSLEKGVTIEQFRQLASGALLALYRFEPYKATPKKRKPAESYRVLRGE